MPSLTATIPVRPAVLPPSVKPKTSRVESIDLLRGVIMIIMALDHVRDYFHYDAFLFDPADLSRTNFILFFTRWITHFCAPVFVFLAGTSAFLYGSKRTTKELSSFLFKRGLWLIVIEIVVLSFLKSFNPAFHFIRLQVIWAIALCMIALSVAVYWDKRVILGTGLLMIATHNLLDTIHVPGGGVSSFLWSVLHEPANFALGPFSISVLYPLIPWIGVMFAGYYCGSLYARGSDQESRKRKLLFLGIASIALFVLLRSGNFYGDAARWSVQEKSGFSLLSFINVTKYPPSLLYLLVTLGPSFIFLALAEKPLSKWGEKLTIYGRTAMFYYLVHFLLIHIFAVFGALILGYKFSDMVLSTSVLAAPQLKGYGFGLPVVYGVWAGLVLLLYPICKRFDTYKRAHVSEFPWLSYF